jgi:hypothetical protein
MSGNTEMISWIRSGEPVSALEALVSSSETGGTLHIAYPDKLSAMLDKQNGVCGWSCCLEVSPRSRSDIDRNIWPD